MNQRRLRRVGAIGIAGMTALIIFARCVPEKTERVAVVKGAETKPVEVKGPTEFELFTTNVQPFLVQNCISCHGDVQPEAGVRLNGFTSAESLETKSKTLVKALEMMRARKMPPPESPRPAEEAIRPVVAWLEGYEERLALLGPKTPGHVTMRRLNRAEYNNTIRDLLAVDYNPADAFPVDDAGYGFDNNGDVLSMAPMLMDKYMATATAVLKRAVEVDPVVAPPLKQWEGATAAGSVPKSDPKATNGGFGFGANMPNGRVFQTGGEIHGEYDFPATGTYLLRVRGWGNAGTVNKQSPIVQFRIDGEDVEKQIAIKNDQRGSLLYSTLPIEVEAGRHRVSVVFVNGPTEEEVAVAATRPAVVPAVISPAFANAPKVAGADGVALAVVVAGVVNGGGVGAGGAGAGGAGGAAAQRRLQGGFNGPKASPTGKPNLGIVYFEAEGPQEISLDRMPESFKKVFVTLPSETVTREEAAREIIGKFATRAFRRPVRAEELERFMGFWSEIDKGGEDFDRSIELALQPVLVSPSFLYRVEMSPGAEDAGGIRTLDEFELASRLSYFLWSSMPDDELFSLAQKGELRKNLAGEVKRMLADPKSMALVDNFAGQWLQLRMMNEVMPDAKKFPDFDESLRAAMIKETQLFFSAIMREDRSVLEFIDSDFTYMNERLARHYGRTDVKGEEFRRVELADKQRGGIFTQASILTITSYPNRTSPVIRGKWVLENLLDAAPPPPPPDVPKLSEGAQIDLSATLRTRMEQHRSNPNCISCHSQMDPIGFGLENFNAIGEWRDKDVNGEAIDSSGTLPGGVNFAGASGLKEILMSKKDQFCKCLSNRMMTYALGRGMELTDGPVVEKVAEGLKANGYRWSSLIMQIVESDAFQKQGFKRGDS